jgi:hypothetical protein
MLELYIGQLSEGSIVRRVTYPKGHLSARSLVRRVTSPRTAESVQSLSSSSGSNMIGQKHLIELRLVLCRYQRSLYQMLLFAIKFNVGLSCIPNELENSVVRDINVSIKGKYSRPLHAVRSKLLS